MDEDDEEFEGPDVVGKGVETRLRMLAIVTAFELLSGQGSYKTSNVDAVQILTTIQPLGEALTLDLGEFIVQLYALLHPLCLDTNIEHVPVTKGIPMARKPTAAPIDPKKKKGPTDRSSTADLLFRCLHLVFFSRHAHTANSPPWRAAAFAKRLLECSLHFPAATSKKAIEFVKMLVGKEAKLEALLATEDRTADGIYRSDLDDPQLANPFAGSFWELGLLERDHWDEDIRKQAGLLANGRLG